MQETLPVLDLKFAFCSSFTICVAAGFVCVAAGFIFVAADIPCVSATHFWCFSNPLLVFQQLTSCVFSTLLLTFQQFTSCVAAPVIFSPAN